MSVVRGPRGFSYFSRRGSTRFSTHVGAGASRRLIHEPPQVDVSFTSPWPTSAGLVSRDYGTGDGAFVLVAPATGPVEKAVAAKLFAAPVGKEVADFAMQVMGGAGYCREYPVERLWRDAKLLEIGGGTIEAHQKNLTKDLTRALKA